MKCTKWQGFTLIEVMIVVAIIGILAAIAYPSYRGHVQDTRRAECQAAMLGLASAMERHFSRNNAYNNPMPTLGNGAGDIFPASCPTDGGPASYNLNLAAATATTFQISAVPTGGQADDPCGTLTLDQRLQKGQSSGTLARCWQ